MLINKNYCDENTCVALRELGYNYPQRLIPDYFGVFEEPQYDERIHLYDAQQWLREEKDLHIEVRWNIMWYEYEVKEAEGKVIAEGSAFLTYEDALSTAVRMAVGSLKEKQDGIW